MSRWKTFVNRVHALVRAVPRGRVVTYGQIAQLAGRPRAAREVGWIAHAGGKGIPWQRVVNRAGGLASGYTGGRAGHGRPRTVELWSAYHEGHIYLLGHPESNWVKNVAANSRVTLEMDDATFEGAARLADSKRAQVYTLFQHKYGADQVSYWYGGEGAQRLTIEIVLRLAAH